MKQMIAQRTPVSALALVLTLAAPAAAQTAYRSDTPYRTETVQIPLASGDEAGHWTEWKVRARAGQPLVYSWSVSGVANPEEFYVDFHGHTEPPAAEREDSYHRVSGLYASGALTTPFDGLHGWYFKNDSAGAVVVHLRVSGFYEPLTPEEIAAHLEGGS